MRSVLLWAWLVSAAGAPPGGDRVQLTLDVSQAEAVLAILETRAAGKPVAEPLWGTLLASEPYTRLKARETGMGRQFGDDDFRRFVMSEDLLRRAPELRRTLDAWKKTDLQAVGERILPYLPAEARVRARVYPVIKPKTNSFVFEAGTNPAIFLYVDPEQSPAAFANTVAHESHHIGFTDAAKRYDQAIHALPENARKAAEWMGAFGEGLAVLAAAGSPDVHPLRDFPADDAARWDQDAKYLEQQVAQLDQFFRDVASGGFARPEVADHVAFTFFGYRGPWYTVGYAMGAAVEKRRGRAALVACMADPRTLLAEYNRVAEELNAAGGRKLPLWSADLLRSVKAEPLPAPQH
jgi:hypothetical protein